VEGENIWGGLNDEGCISVCVFMDDIIGLLHQAGIDSQLMLPVIDRPTSTVYCV
jgi:hypothetical protein